MRAWWPPRWSAPCAGTKQTATSPRAAPSAWPAPLLPKVLVAQALACANRSSGRSSDRCLATFESMRVLVTFAVDAEFAPWRKRHSFKRQELSVPHSYRFDAVYTAEVNQVAVDVYLTGMGWSGV